MESRTPPQNLEAEQSVLGSILLDNEAFHAARDLLTPERFYKDGHRKIFRAMDALAESGSPIDLVTLTEALRTAGELDAVGSVPYLIGLADGVPTAAYADSYAKIVAEKATLRDLIAASGGMMQSAYDQQLPLEQIVDQAERAVYRLSVAGTLEDGRSALEVTGATMDYFQRLAELKGAPSGLSTGFADLDGYTLGLQPGSLNVLAARPSMGKSAMALNIAQHAALKLRQSVLFFSLEMSAEQMMGRMVAGESRVSMDRIQKGLCSERDWQRLSDVSAKFGASPLVIDDNVELSIAALRSKCRKHKAKHGLNLVVVDYLQLMDVGNSENQNLAIAKLSRGMKTLARELDIPVLLLSQLSRGVEKRPNKRPMLSDLRDSGAVEQDADLVMFIYRDDYYDPNSERQGIAEIIIGKQRNGPVGTVELSWLPDTTRFADLSRLAA